MTPKLEMLISFLAEKLSVTLRYIATAPVFECDFESGTCGFVQVRRGWGSSYDSDDWTRHTGPTPNSFRKSGPGRDHTTGSGYYMYYNLQFEGTKRSPYGEPAIDDIYVGEYYKSNATNLTAVQNNVCINKYVNLDCRLVGGFPEPDQCKFYKNESQEWTQSNCKLNAKSTVVGTHIYRCLPSNVLGDAQNKTITIVTHDNPKFKDPIPSATTIIEGNTLTIFANVTGNGPFKYTWTKRYSSSAVYPDQSNLTIQSVSSSHRGSYSVTVTDKMGCIVSSGWKQVNVHYKPNNAYISYSSTPFKVCLNGALDLYCYSTSNPSPNKYTYMVDGNVVQSSSSRFLRIKSTLVGEYVYACIPSNVVGSGPNATRTVITQAPPNITWSSPNITATEGSKVLISCNITGSEPMTVSWTRVGVGSVPGNSSILTLNSVTTEDNGGYYCTASNGNTCPIAKSTPTFLHVTYKPRDTNFTVSNSSQCLNYSLTFECSAIGDPPVDDYLFYVNDHLLGTSKTGKLEIITTVVGNNTYRCQPKNSVGLGENATVVVNIKAPPDIPDISAKQDIHEHTVASLFCNVTGSEPMEIKWRKLGSAPVLGFETNFTIAKILRSQEGVYEVTASNGHECPITRSSTSIDVLWEPEFTTLPERSLTLKENKQVELTCKSIGDPTPNITWSRGNVTLGTNENLVLTAEESEPGTYTCTARNGVGKEQKATSNVVANVCDNACQNNGSCISKGTTVRCKCALGFRASRCQTVDKVSEKFDISFEISSPQWQDDYKDSSSNLFKKLEEEICNEMWKSFVDLLICALLSVRKGSIIAGTELIFNETKRETEVLNVLSITTANNTLGTLTLSKSGNFSVSARSSDGCALDPCKFDGKCIPEGDSYSCECKLFRYGSHCEKGIGLAIGVILIILVCIAVIIIIFVCVFCCRWLAKKNRYSTESHPAAIINMESYRKKDSIEKGQEVYENTGRASTQNKYQPEPKGRNNPIYENREMEDPEYDNPASYEPVYDILEKHDPDCDQPEKKPNHHNPDDGQPGENQPIYENAYVEFH